MPKDRLGQEGRDEPGFPKPRMKLSGDSILEPTALNRVRPLFPNDNPLTTVVVDTRSSCWQGVVMWRSCLLQTVLKFTSAGEHRIETLRGTQAEQKSRTDLMKPEGTQLDTHSPPGDALTTALLRWLWKIQALMALLGEK